MKLTELSHRVEAQVETVQELAPNDAIARRLRELGFVEGERVEVVASGPFGAEPLLGDLKTVLLINAGLDVAYMLGGIYLLTRPEATWRGSGVAVLIQGGFLLAFDLIHALLI